LYNEQDIFRYKLLVFSSVAQASTVGFRLMDHAIIEEVLHFLRQQIVNSQPRKKYLILKIQKTTDERGSQ